jgi:hypothetical protein
MSNFPMDFPIELSRFTEVGLEKVLAKAGDWSWGCPMDFFPVKNPDFGILGMGVS